jgi:polyphosphate kinase 2
MNKADYEIELKKLQLELVYLQEWVKQQSLKVLVIFEGRDAAGKGGVIKAITARLNPRVVKIVALSKPSDKERSQWYFQRYVEHLPAEGELVLFDRSWYNRAGIEKVMGFCTDQEHEEFLRACPEFEGMLMRSGTILLKYWFSVSDDEQEKRFKERLSNPLKRWKFSEMDLHSRGRWIEYSKAKDAMFAYTDTMQSPWFVVDAEDKRSARLNCIEHILKQIPYKKITYPNIQLPAIDRQGYVRPPMHQQQHVNKKHK